MAAGRLISYQKIGGRTHLEPKLCTQPFSVQRILPYQSALALREQKYPNQAPLGHQS